MDAVLTGDAKAPLYEAPATSQLKSDQKVLVDGPQSGAESMLPGEFVTEAAKYVGSTPTQPSTGGEVLVRDGAAVSFKNIITATGREHTYYLGPSPTALLVQPSGLPLVSGNTYFNTTDRQMYVRTSGAVPTWQPVGQPFPGKVRSYVFYVDTERQFFGGTDALGEELVVDTQQGDTVSVYLNGAKQAFPGDYQIMVDGDYAGAVRLSAMVEPGSVVEVQIFDPIGVTVDLTPLAVDTSIWVYDGVSHTFPLKDMQGRHLSTGTGLPDTTLNMMVFRNGLFLNPLNEYYVNTDINGLGYIYFTDPPDPGDKLWMQIGVPISGPILTNGFELGDGSALEVGPGIPVFASGDGSPEYAASNPTELPDGLVPLDVLPAPGVGYHGKFSLISGTGITDQLYICVKQANGSYTWLPVIYPLT